MKSPSSPNHSSRPPGAGWVPSSCPEPGWVLYKAPCPCTSTSCLLHRSEDCSPKHTHCESDSRQISAKSTRLTFSWYVCGQLLSAVALQQFNKKHPYDFRLAIYTQWGMLGGLFFVYLLLPESPCKLFRPAPADNQGGWSVRTKRPKPSRFCND